ncbi:hypothetical protein JHD49_11055 [Sulfurimonas sp. SAG-AH-194-C21]|nr:hypothetical protein [Sulfurimonas sp. SAG-AH-194-C21]MDF1884479.1 hypothetical protein [Sulfurimonas sp. SAG-AH-194-C21]
MKRFIFGVFLLLVGISLNAGQFGLKIGMTLNQIDKNAKKISDTIYEVKVPKVHSFFESYIVRISPTKGLYWVKAISKNIDTSVYGEELKSSFDDLENKLLKAYGKNKRLDFLRYESIWSEPKDWMMALRKKERTLMSYWDKETGLKEVDNLKQIIISAYPINTNKGYITLEYYYSIYDECKKEKATIEDDSL